MSDSFARFRIRPDCIEAALANFRESGVIPSRIIERRGEFAVEFDSLTQDQAAAIAATFHPEHSAIIGVIGVSPFESH